MSARLTVSVIGTGRMGAAMARRISAGGFALAVWNRDRAKAEQVAEATGATVMDTARRAAGADVVVTSLADDAAVRDVYLGPDGICEGIAPGTVVVDTSTIDPMTTAEIGDGIDAAGGGFLDAPVSGSVSTVDSGALTVMVGGDGDLLDRVRPVLDTMASRIVSVGPRGSGSIAKLAVNGLVHGLNVALSEALVLAEKAGLDRAVAYDIFASGAAGAPFVQYKREAYEHPEDAAVAFSLDLVAKDLELITGLARRVGAPMRQAEEGLEIVQAAVAAGLGSSDLSAIAVHLRGEES
jgi:3-hydroxyisobutyrate dehydrogenase-like beta-hydroxyacid dehydrogenase